MKNFVLYLAVLCSLFSLSASSFNNNDNLAIDKITLAPIPFKLHTDNSILKIDNSILSQFFKKYPQLIKYQFEINILYKNRNYNSIWYDNKGLIEFANLLYSKINGIKEDGIESHFAYENKIDSVFSTDSGEKLSKIDTELLLSSMYVFYAKKVYLGINPKKIIAINWFLPRKDLPYETLLDSLLMNPNLLNKNEVQLFSQYYKLRDVLKKYRQIEQNKDWEPITTDSLDREYKLTDSSKTIGQIRHRLTVIGDLKQDSKSNVYDYELLEGILNYKKRNGFKNNYIIEYKHIQSMNIPIEKRIKTIIVNMERCRWIDPNLTKADEYIIVNIPSYKLLYKKNGETVLESKAIIGKNNTETVIFSSEISQIVFSPTWNVPKSIIDNELKIALVEDKNFMTSHNMVWEKGKLIQKPGITNPMGLVKFVFPNSNNIYLHDTPAKNLFDFEYGAFSHGCININKAKELAELILKNDPNWTTDAINEAMKGEKATAYTLKNKIPIHIGYFTAWVNDSGEISFYNDIYNRDDRLTELLFTDNLE